jgi:hypothetical protein
MNKVSLVIACLALLVSTAGGAYAGASSLIGSKQIKDHSVQYVDLSKKAAAKLRGQRGPRGYQGPQGLTGSQGAPGLNGSQGAPGLNGGFDPNKLNYVTGPDTVIPAGELGGASAACPAGSKVLGGGFYESIGEAFGSGFTGDGNAWFETVDNISGIDITVNAYAVCAAK